ATERIGTAILDRLRGFGCRVLAYDNRPKTSADYVPLDELLRQSNVVTLQTPLTADTHHLLNRQRIAQMKHGALIANAGRDSLVDTEAIVPSLVGGRLGGAALDVLEGEQGIFHRSNLCNLLICGARNVLRHSMRMCFKPLYVHITLRRLSGTNFGSKMKPDKSAEPPSFEEIAIACCADARRDSS